MRIVNSIYPYPVLSIDDEDYVNTSIFDAEFTSSPATTFKKAQIHCNFILHDGDLEKLVKQGKAGFYLHVENPRTAFRKLYAVEKGKNTFDLEIDTDYMRQKVEITGLLLAKEEIDGYMSKSVNSELYGSDYIFPTLNIGDPLAVAFTTNINIEDSDSFKSVTSIMKVAKSNTDYMIVNPDGEIVYINLPEKQYQQYVKYQSMQEVILTMVILPALTQLLNYIVINNSSDIDGQKWYMVIERKIKSLDMDISDLMRQDISALELAQRILDNPLERAFEEIRGVIESED